MGVTRASFHSKEASAPEATFETPAAEKIMKHMYVDNLLTGVKSSKEESFIQNQRKYFKNHP